MDPTYFKLTEPDGVTRRLTFSNRPTWNVLTSRIELLYGIPIEKVSVTYLDSDNDQVTLSSQEELDDFYEASFQPGQVIKFTIQDLSSVRSTKPLPKPPINPKVHDPFSPGDYDIEDDWQSLPLSSFPGLGGLFGPRIPTDTTSHAFVEVIESDAGHIPNAPDNHNVDRQSVRHSTINSSTGSPFIMSSDKGKGKATLADDTLSTASVLAEDAPLKPPVHVYNVGSRDESKERADVSPTHTSPAATIRHRSVGHIATDGSTPKISTQGLATSEPGVPRAESGSGPLEDLPLPSTDSSAPLSNSPSLSNDVASLLDALRNAIGAHPELSEGFRNIIRNASSGTYWNAHREAVSQAAQELANAAGKLRRDAEEETGRRIVDALGGIFQSLAQAPISNDGDSVPPNPPAPMTDTLPDRGSQPVQFERPFSGYKPRPHIPPPSPQAPFLSNPWMPMGVPSNYRWGSRVPPPPPFGPPFSHIPGRLDPYDGPPLGNGPFQPPPTQPLPGSWYTPAQGGPPPPPPVDEPNRSKSTAEELKAQVNEAKARYKAEKERYRQEREQLRQARDNKTHLTSVESQVPTTSRNAPPVEPSTSPAIAVHGRKGNPTLEVVNVHRNNTHLGHKYISRRPNQGPNDFTSRALNRIVRRLADMGFTENAYPNLVSRIKALLPSEGVLANEDEDNIVTTLLEELLAMSPKPPAASGSGARPGDIPGAWH